MRSHNLIDDRDFIAGRFRNIINALYRIGPRNITHYKNLNKAQLFLEIALRKTYSLTYLHQYEARGRKFHNIIAEKTGTTKPEEIIIVGAHYDTHKNSPGRENGSALSVLLQLAEDFSFVESSRTVRFVCFVNEKPPFTRTKHMGSLVYSRFCRENNENIVGMLCLEKLGNYLPKRIFLKEGNFLTVVANNKSKELLKQVSSNLKQYLRVESKILPEFFIGRSSSDHWSFWKEDYPAVMVTDTSFLKETYFHTKQDTPEKINYQWLTYVYEGLRETINQIINKT